MNGTDIFFKTIQNKDKKEAVAQKIGEKLHKGDFVGVGSGSSSYLALLALNKRRVNEGLSFIAIPTSHEMDLVCASLGIPTTSLLHAVPDWSFDGADEIDSVYNMIKGRGGALFREKLVIASSKKTYILADKSKFVSKLGKNFSVPVEVHPEALSLVENRLKELNATDITLRMATGKDGPILTEKGHFLLDVRFEDIKSTFEKEIKAIPGVMETGLFMGYPIEVITME